MFPVAFKVGFFVWKEHFYCFNSVSCVNVVEEDRDVLGVTESFCFAVGAFSFHLYAVVHHAVEDTRGAVNA